MKCFVRACDGVPVVAGQYRGETVLACTNCKWRIRGQKIPLTEQTVIVGVEVVAAPKPETLYVVCSECGEAWTSLRHAKSHEGAVILGQTVCEEVTYEILPESEAM